MPAKSLKPPGQRSNRWLFKCLRSLSHCELSGIRDETPWQSVLVSEWGLSKGNTEIHILLPPLAAELLKSRITYARIESSILHSMPRSRHSQKLFAVLADRRRQDRPTWTYSLDELREALDLNHQRQYTDWTRLRQKVLVPAINTINANSPVQVAMTPIKLGRQVTAVRFDWDWSGYSPSSANSLPETESHTPDDGHAEGTDPDNRTEEAREWWAGTDRKTRKYTLLKLGIANPGSEDLQDESPYALEAWQLIRDLKAPPDEREHQRDARRRVRGSATTEREQEFERLLDDLGQRPEDMPIQTDPPETGEHEPARDNPFSSLSRPAAPEAQPTSLLPFPSTESLPETESPPPARGDPTEQEEPPDDELDQLSWYESLIGQ